MSESQACIPTFLTTHALLIVRWGVVAGGLLAARCCNHYGSTLHAIAGHDSSNRLVGMFQASGTTPPSKACAKEGCRPITMMSASRACTVEDHHLQQEGKLLQAHLGRCHQASALELCMLWLIVSTL